MVAGAGRRWCCEQPDLGTAVMLMAGGGALLFLAGVRWWKFGIAGVGGARRAADRYGSCCTTTSGSGC